MVISSKGPLPDRLGVTLHLQRMHLLRGREEGRKAVLTRMILRKGRRELGDVLDSIPRTRRQMR